MHKLILPFFITSLAFMSCEQNTQQITKKEIALVSQNNDEEIVGNETEDIAEGDLQLEESLELREIYIDTVTFISANYDYDYWFMDTQKNSDTLVFQIDDIYEFTRGDKLEIKWSVDSVPFEGDGGMMYRSNQAISIKKT